MNTQTTYVAMWSGPRNISTAMMRAWENRLDTAVVDEPLYAHYLLKTGLDHPGADEIIAHYETDWRRVTADLTGPIPDDNRIFYQKHMTHHLLDHITLDWVHGLQNCFLIRDPEEMVTSYLRVRPEKVTVDELGLPQQIRLFDYVCEHIDPAPPVLDARDVLEDPPRMLRLLCERVGVPFRPEMLSWPPGRRDTDGIWADYWYARVEQSTGFAPYRPKDETVPAEYEDLLAECERLYTRMAAHKLT